MEIPPILIRSDSSAFLHFFPIDTASRNTFAGVLFFIITMGETTVEVNGRPYRVHKGSLLTLLPSHLLQTTKYSKDFTCLTLAFTFDSMSDFSYMVQSSIAEKMECTPCIQLTNIELSQLTNWHQAATSHYTLTTHPSYLEILRSLIFIFTAEVSSIYCGKPIKASASHHEEMTDAFFRLLHEHCHTRRETTFYADRLCISSKYLSRVILRVTGHAPSHWIAEFTVREAKMLLKSSSHTITQLSEKLNFPNSSFFARYFKRRAGVSPQKYRLSQLILK